MGSSNYKRSPCGRRMIAALRGGLTGDAEQLAAAIHCARSSALHLLYQMHRDGVIRVAGWRRDHPGVPSRVYAWALTEVECGPPAPAYASRRMKDAPKPAKRTNAEKCKRYRKRMYQRFGPIAKKMLNPGPGLAVIRVGGITVWKRGGAVIDRISQGETA